MRYKKLLLHGGPNRTAAPWQSPPALPPSRWPRGGAAQLGDILFFLVPECQFWELLCEQECRRCRG
ncbi:hypothetical protein BS78_06G096900 [Paspalum vaginatum]|nr:hypothetical protein BS78_06G096900 [Paspalum vaginatum]